jgi:GNAT superfamily N-acetyltransferase
MRENWRGPRAAVNAHHDGLPRGAPRNLGRMAADVSVRPARPEDGAAVGRVQLSTWLSAYAPILPPGMLAALREEELAARWRTAAEQPPTPRHHLLVALDGDEVVGFSAFGPATDPDRGPGQAGELYTLLVEPSASRTGHGSRLLAATAEQMREDGFRTAVTWLLASDDTLRAFLAGAGWAADGSRRSLATADEPAEAVLHQVRLHTDLTEEAR